MVQARRGLGYQPKNGPQGEQTNTGWKQTGTHTGSQMGAQGGSQAKQWQSS